MEIKRGENVGRDQEMWTAGLKYRQLEATGQDRQAWMEASSLLNSVDFVPLKIIRCVIIRRYTN